MNFKRLLLLIAVINLCAIGQTYAFDFHRQQIEKVEIEGNRAIPDGKIKSQILTKQNGIWNILSKRKISEVNLKFDINLIKRIYGREGFLFSSAGYEVSYYKNDSTRAVVKFKIDEGPRTYVDAVILSGGFDKINEGLVKFVNKIKTEQPVNNELVRATTFEMRDYYADNSYPNAQITQNYEFSEDTTRAIVRYTITPNNFVYNGEIKIAQEGTAHTKDNIIRRELVVKPGEPFSRKKVIESQQRLYSTGLMRFVSLRRTVELDSIAPDTAIADFRLVVNERLPRFINLTTGFGQDPDFTNVFTTAINMGSRNLWGYGRKLIMTGRIGLNLSIAGGKDLSKMQFKDIKNLQTKLVKSAVELDYVEPWLLNVRMPLSITVAYEPRNKNPDLDLFYSRKSGDAALFKALNQFTTLKFSTRVEFVNFLDVEQQPVFEKELLGDNAQRRRLSVYGQRDTRDNILAPQDGAYSYVSADYVGGILGGDFSYFKGEFYWSRFQNVGGDDILASRFRVGILQEFGSDTLSSSDDRFKLGGGKTMRAYGENEMGTFWGASDGLDSTSVLYGKPKGGRLLLLTTVELRKPLFWRFGGTAFVDIGNIFYHIEDFKLSRIAVGPGLGLQFFTPIGPIRFDGAVRLQRNFDLSEGALHLSILYAF